MCEVEFWEVFLKGTKHFLVVCYRYPLVDCRIAELERYSYRIVKVQACPGAISRQYCPTPTATTSRVMPA